MRALPLLVLVACNTADAPTGLVVAADLQATTCDGAPCTHVSVDVFLDGAIVDPTTVLLSANGEPPIAVPRDGAHNVIEIPGWVTRARVDVTTDEETAFVEGANRLTSPFEMAAALPATIAVGSIPELTWRAQGGYVRATTLFATKVPALRFGFVETEGKDDGKLALENIFTHEGEYTISLYRSVDHDGIRWGSNWQTRVFAVTNPK